MKQNTKNRKRRLTAMEKKLTHMAGMEPRVYLYAGEDDSHLFLTSKLDGSRVSVPKNPDAVPEN